MYDLTSQRLLAGAAGAGAKLYVEDVFQTWLYTGNGSTQTITNGIDLSGKGGLVWMKSRTSPTQNWEHCVVDTARGVRNTLVTNGTYAAFTASAGTGLTAFNSNGFTLGSNSNGENPSTAAVASWTFRKQAKFFDVVTWTGDGTFGRQISHSLGSVPGCIIAKRTDSTSNWVVYHRSILATQFLELNVTSAVQTGSFWGNTAATSTYFTTNASPTINASGGTYVAYLFAHDAGGFGDSGNDSIIKCGSFTGAGYLATTTINLGWEPQWILAKRTDAVQGWVMFDNMRGMDYTSSAILQPNTSGAEASWDSTGYFRPTPTGFTYGPDNYMGDTAQIIYIAIRRGPMKTPTDATKVFYPDAVNTAAGSTRTTGFPVDMQITKLSRNQVGTGNYVVSRLTGASATNTDTSLPYLNTISTNAEFNAGLTRFWDNTGYKITSAAAGTNNWYLNFRRAPGFFDVVAYTGTGSARTVSHNLGVVPELMIVKLRNTPGAGNLNWTVYSAALGNSSRVFLNSDSASGSTTVMWDSTTPGSSSFTVGTSSFTNDAAGIYIAYLFASCPGVSKVGSYTGTGTTLSIDCGFTNGARFVLIKRTDSTGDWYVWDTARGIIAANDPYLLINSENLEDTSTDYIDPLSSGFQISSTAPAAINANGGSFIYLAIA